MYDSMTALVKGCFSVITFIATTIMMGLFNALVLTVLWRWFVAPVFHVPTFTVLQGWGLAMFLSFASFRFDKDDTASDTIVGSLAKSGGKLLITGLVCLGMGWLLLHFV